MKKRLLSLALALLLAIAAAQPAAALPRATAHRVPYATVKTQLEGGTETLEKYGVTRERVVAELSAHEGDRYYLGTPYVSGDHQSPNGDLSYNGYAGMNCAGFVSYVLRKCGLNPEAALADIRKGFVLGWSGGGDYDLLAGASNYYNLVQYGGLSAFVYPDKASLLAGGRCEKGDLLLRYWTSFYDSWDDEDNHLMFFWGDRPDQDRVWHSDRPENAITAIDGSYAGAFVLIKFAPASPAVAGFEDVRERHWFAPAVAYVKKNGLMSGLSDAVFAPGDPVTRAQAVTLLYQLAGRPAVSGEPGFEDVPPDKWYAAPVTWARETGLASGVGEGLFDPGAPVRRQDLAVLFYHFAGPQEPSDEGRLADFPDGERVSSYARQAMAWAVDRGLLSGDGTGLAPRGTATRAQAAVILMKYHQLTQSPEEAPQQPDPPEEEDAPSPSPENP